MFISREMFRRIVDISDKMNVWFKSFFNLDAKKRLLEIQQDRKWSVSEMERTIGSSLR